MNTAIPLSEMGIKIFRAGIWKPRTRPNAFEGVGSGGLKWLQRVKKETGMLVATEVANVKHVYEALKYGVDIIWIGARTSANPFAVQDIADSLRGVNIPSMEWTAQGDNMLASLDYMINVWGCNLLRIPLAQDRWYGYGPEQSDAGVAYKRLVEAIVKNGDEKGAYIWLDLHWSNGNIWGQYIGQHQMPDEKSIKFWQDVATTYKNHPAVLFGLYNEPHGIGWDMWLNGGEYTEHYDRGGEAGDLTYRAVGHQELYEKIRKRFPGRFRDSGVKQGGE